MHPRRLVREAVKAALLNKTVAGTRVFETRVVNYEQVQLPAISVYIDTETVADTSKASAPRELERSAQVAIEAVVQASTDVEDAMDAIALEIETAMHADDTLGGTARDSVLVSTESETGPLGSKRIGMIRIVYAVDYRTYAPEVAVLPDFAGANIRYDLENKVETAREAQDKINRG